MKISGKPSPNPLKWLGAAAPALAGEGAEPRCCGDCCAAPVSVAECLRRRLKRTGFLVETRG